jgi:hypothetical protein
VRAPLCFLLCTTRRKKNPNIFSNRTVMRILFGCAAICAHTKLFLETAGESVAVILNALFGVWNAKRLDAY